MDANYGFFLGPTETGRLLLKDYILRHHHILFDMCLGGIILPRSLTIIISVLYVYSMGIRVQRQKP